MAEELRFVTTLGVDEYVERLSRLGSGPPPEPILTLGGVLLMLACGWGTVRFARARSRRCEALVLDWLHDELGARAVDTSHES